jgi:hypothetical protein
MSLTPAAAALAVALFQCVRHPASTQLLASHHDAEMRSYRVNFRRPVKGQYSKTVDTIGPPPFTPRLHGSHPGRQIAAIDAVQAATAPHWIRLCKGFNA